MKYKIDSKWKIEKHIDAALNMAVPGLDYERVPTTANRQILLLMAERPAVAQHVYAAIDVDVSMDTLKNVRGLCVMMFQQPVNGVCPIAAVYDAIVAVFYSDSGFRRGPRSIARTAGHEAVHAAKGLAAKELGLSAAGDAVFTREFEESTAEWTGYLTVEFMHALRALAI